ncbi:MAG: hypothetical protein ABSA47_19135 [Verrucomicrobiota bacterium]|jgi:hypothetical protein
MNPVCATLLFLGCFLVGVAFVARFIAAPFSPKIKQQMSRHRIILGVWACFGVFSLFVVWFVFFDPFAWPPNWLQRQTQRQTVEQRVQEAGGWEAVRRGCESLITNYPDGLRWYPPEMEVRMYPNVQTDPTNSHLTNIDYGPIPKVLAALQPRGINFDRLMLVRAPTNGPPFSVVHLWLLGEHSTGRSSRWFGLEVPCGPGAEGYTPEGSAKEFCSNNHPGYRKMADRVYEVTW